MASNPLRAAHAMKALVSNGMRALTSRTIASTYGNNLTICNSRLLHTHWTSQTNTSIATPIRQFRFMSTAAAEQAQPVDGSTKRDVKSGLRNLERAAQAFEDRTVNREQVLESDFVRLFDNFAKSVEEDPEGSADDCSTHSQIAGLLLKCCGNLMYDVPPKGRELLAGNLWTFIKEKNVPIDISHYNSLLRLLNENGTTFNPQMIMDEIKQHSLQPDRVTYQRLIHQYCLQGDIANATKLLETMKDADVELTEAIFASLILGYSKQDSPPSSNEMFELMRSNGIEPGAKAYVASLVALAGRFNADPASASKELADIFTSISAQDIILTPNDQIDLINHLGPLANSHESVANLINSFLDLRVSIGYKYKILTALLRANLFELASKAFWNQMPSDRAVERGNIGRYYLQALCRNHNIPVEFVMQESAKLEEKRWFTKATHASFREAAIAGRVDLVRALLKRMIASEPLKALYTWPLIAQAKNQDDIIRVLREDLDPRLDSNQLLETFSQWVWPKFADDVQKLFEVNKDLKYDVNILLASYLNYAVQSDKIEEAIKFITELPSSYIDGPSRSTDAPIEDEPTGVQPINERNSLIARLLEHIAEQSKNPELVKKAFNMCSVPGQLMSSRALAPLIKVHLLNNNFNEAIEEFLLIARAHRLTPCRHQLMQHCLEHKDADSLQKIMNACTEIYGESNSLFDLAICCLGCGKLRQAQKIFANPGFRVRPVRVYQACRQIAEKDDIEMLENFVNFVREMYDVNQEYLYQTLLDTYDRTSNVKRALNLWNQMQEEEFQPSKRNLNMIADLLEKNNMPVPFTRPSTSSR